MKDTIIYEFRKNDAEKIVVSFSIYEGREYYHIRTYVRSGFHGSQNYLPTPKGISFNHSQLSSFFVGVDKLKKFLDRNEIADVVLAAESKPMTVEETVSFFGEDISYVKKAPIVQVV